MKLSYDGGKHSVRVAGQVVARGGVGEFADDVAASLLATGQWSEVKPPKKNPPTTKGS